MKPCHHQTLLHCPPAGSRINDPCAQGALSDMIAESRPGMQAKLLQIYNATEDWRQQRLQEQLVLAINRSDYMLDEPSSTLMQA